MEIPVAKPESPENKLADEIRNDFNTIIDILNEISNSEKIQKIDTELPDIVDNIISRLKFDSYFRRDNEGKIMDNQYVMEIQLGENVNKENVYEYISGIMNIKNR